MAKKSVISSITNGFKRNLEDIVAELIDLRKTLHINAELSGSEQTTAIIIRNFLDDLNPDTLIEQVGGNGILAQFNGTKPGPKICFRAELDALPIHENNEFDHRSLHVGVAHKCGHDGHMTILCGLGKLLSQFPPERGSIILLFQPAEETGEGAAKILTNPQFISIGPDFIFALHNFPGFPLNQIILKSGTLFCASRGMIIKLTGKTCHAAHPEEGLNPVTAVCEILTALRSLPNEPAFSEVLTMVTIIYVNLGEVAFGTSPGEAQIMCTLRTSSDETMEELAQKAENIVDRISKIHGPEYVISWTDSFSVTRNDSRLIRTIDEAALNLILETTYLDKPFRPSEDFGLFTSCIRGAMFGIGAGVNHPSLHHSDYDFPDELVKTGILMFYEIVNLIINSEPN